jgi:hypothetical protein
LSSSSSDTESLFTGQDVCISTTEAISLDETDGELCEVGTHVCVSAEFQSATLGGCVRKDSVEAIKESANQLCVEDVQCAAENPNGATTFFQCNTTDCNPCVPYDGGEGSGEDTNTTNTTNGSPLSCLSTVADYDESSSFGTAICEVRRENTLGIETRCLH